MKINLFKRKKNATSDQKKSTLEKNLLPSKQPSTPQNHPTTDKKPFVFKRLNQGLGKTRNNLFSGISTAFLGKKNIDNDILEQLETQLLMADIGVTATQEIIDNLTKRSARKMLANSEALFTALKEDMKSILKTVEQPLVISTQHKPFVMLMVGVNGAGKTTTIGKLAKQFQSENKKVMLAAGDTFRAAAIEQLQVWGKRNDITVIAQQGGADSAAVIFDAITSATARQTDVLIADTAGRLHSQDHLMAELKKIHRVIQKSDASAPHETLLVLDAHNGQNALAQAKKFNEAIDISGICLTKLDGTAKGGIIFALAKQLNLPIRFIGIGEGIDDLRPFSADEFVEALFISPEKIKGD